MTGGDSRITGEDMAWGRIVTNTKVDAIVLQLPQVVRDGVEVVTAVGSQLGGRRAIESMASQAGQQGAASRTPEP